MDEHSRLVFGKDLISINNQNLEEAEELEDRKRREEEIHNLLSHAMSEFNYDDQSTINSSVASNDGEHYNSLPLKVQTAYKEQYQKANTNDQLKVLYEVRVREVMTLNKELEKLRIEFKEQEQNLKKKTILLEAENERKNVSLKESQSLLAEKVGQLKNLEEKIEYLQNKTKNLELNVGELNQDNAILREANMKLEQQMTLMDRGFPLLNRSGDKALQESQRTRIKQLEDLLERTIEQNERKEYKYKESIRELKQGLEEKENNLAEKGILINRLTENFDNAQRNCQGLLKTVEELKQSQKRVEQHMQGPLEEELRKVREQNERVDILRENIKKAMSEEFQVEISKLTSENVKLQDALCKKEEESKETECQLQKLSCIQNEKVDLQRRLKELEDQLNEVNTELSKKIDECEEEKDKFKRKYEDLTATLRNMQSENEVLCKRVTEMESRKQLIEEKLIQTSFSDMNSNELIKLRKEKEEVDNELVTSSVTINDLENRLKLALQENSQLLLKVNLEQERDALIKSLQEKAAQFEKIIFDKQRTLDEIKTSSVGINTDSAENSASVLKIKYDTLLYQTQTSLRKKLKQEFDAKLEKIINETDQKLQSHRCQNCEKVINENRKLKEIGARDREIVAKLADKWLKKFQTLEKQTQSKMVALKGVYQQQLTELTLKLEKGYKEKYKALTSDLACRNNKLLQRNIKGSTLLSERLGRIIKSIDQGNEEIAEIEKQCSQRRADVVKKTMVT